MSSNIYDLFSYLPDNCLLPVYEEIDCPKIPPNPLDDYILDRYYCFENNVAESPQNISLVEEAIWRLCDIAKKGKVELVAEPDLVATICFLKDAMSSLDPRATKITNDVLVTLLANLVGFDEDKQPVVEEIISLFRKINSENASCSQIYEHCFQTSIFTVRDRVLSISKLDRIQVTLQPDLLCDLVRLRENYGTFSGSDEKNTLNNAIVAILAKLEGTAEEKSILVTTATQLFENVNRIRLYKLCEDVVGVILNLLENSEMAFRARGVSKTFFNGYYADTEVRSSGLQIFENIASRALEEALNSKTSISDSVIKKLTEKLKQNVCSLTLSTVPSSIDNAREISRLFPHIRSLRIYPQNNWDRVIPRLCQFKQLEQLDLSNQEGEGVSLTDGCMRSLSGFKKLKVLNISGHNKLTGKGIGALSQSLTALIASGCPLGDRGMEKIAKYTKLKKLNLEYNNITDTGILHLQALKELEMLDISGNSDITGSSFDSLSPLLKKFKMRHCTQVYDESIVKLQNLAGLKLLEVCPCRKFLIVNSLESFPPSVVITYNY